MSVRIVVESSTDVTEAVRSKLSVVPLTVHFGNREYIDGVTIDRKQFYEMLVETDEIPTTSQPSPEAFAQVFRQAKEAGEQVVALTVSSKLSGTYQSAMIAAADFPDDVWVVDSQTVAIGCGILAELALQLKEQGLSAPEIAAKLENEREKVRVIALLDTLEYLKKGGRVSPAVAMAGTLLGIKPVIAILNGEITILGKARGSKNGHNMLRELAEKQGIDFDMPFALAYSGLDDTLLRKYIADSASLYADRTTDLPIYTIGSTIGTHAGPGAVAVAFFSNQ